jgi:N-glycosylase/DNA lyase
VKKTEKMNMKRYEESNNYILEDVKDFLLSQTLECGQCFHFVRISEEEYYISAMGRILHIRQTGNRVIFFDTTEKEYEEIWEHYFDLDRDYSLIKSRLLQADDSLKAAIDEMWGVRILNQDFFETMISFIISQNQQIPRIKQIVANISASYGVKGEALDIFPDVKRILDAGEDGIKACKAGFRAGYIIDACEKYISGDINEENLRALPYDECIEKLKMVKGIGDKVANCIALFALGKRNAFPIDVWMKRIMESLYFDGDTPNSRIAEFARERYGEYGGYAQQYLFYYGKTYKIGRKQEK